MSDENYRKLLEQLHDELERTESGDERGDELRRNLIADIEDRLKRSEKDKTSDDESTIEQLRESIEHFEVTHPTLTMLLSEMATVLSNGGI